MRGFDPELERQFFAIFDAYIDLERNTSRKYTAGEYSLAHMDALAALADHPERRVRVIHVAGTKGKGTTCIFASALMRAAGLRVGTFTSPHLATVRERFLLDGELVPYDTLTAAAQKYEAAVRGCGIHPTFFEIATVIALKLFVDEECEYAVMETGIGGLLDSTNYVPVPVCTAITAISLDHMELLGDTIEEIALQKAGIIKPGVPVVLGRQPFPAAAHVVREMAAAREAPSYESAEQCPAHDLQPWPVENLPGFILEDFQNALAICRVLGIAPDPDRFALPILRGRCESISRDPLVLIDGAHNADSARRLSEAVGAMYDGVSFTVVLGVVKGKDVDGIFAGLLPVSHDFVLTNPRSHKGTELSRLVELAEASGARYTVVPDIRSRDDLPADTSLLFTGSFFTALVGEGLFS